MMLNQFHYKFYYNKLYFYKEFRYNHGYLFHIKSLITSTDQDELSNLSLPQFH